MTLLPVRCFQILLFRAPPRIYVRCRLTLACLTMHQHALPTGKRSLDQRVCGIDVREHIGVGDIVQLDLVSFHKLDVHNISLAVADAPYIISRASCRVDRQRRTSKKTANLPD